MRTKMHTDPLQETDSPSSPDAGHLRLAEELGKLIGKLIADELLPGRSSAGNHAAVSQPLAPRNRAGRHGNKAEHVQSDQSGIDDGSPA
jgi:hypothetical protein